MTSGIKSVQGNIQLSFQLYLAAYELLRRTLGLGSTHRVWRVYLSRLDTRDVVTHSVLDTGMSLLTFLVQNQQRHPSIQHGTSNDIPGIQTAEIDTPNAVCAS